MRQSAQREWVFITPPATFTSLPRWPTRISCLIPASAARSRASPIKLEHFTILISEVIRPLSAKKSAP